MPLLRRFVTCRCAALGAALLALAAVAAAAPPAATAPAQPAKAAPAAASSSADNALLPPVSELGMARMEKMRQPKKPPKQPKPVDINHASAAELKQLPGIGDAEATKIIAGRPYWSKAELVSKKILPAGPYHSVRHRIVALQQGVAPPRRPASAARAKG